jgi:hypothetical protein
MIRANPLLESSGGRLYPIGASPRFLWHHATWAPETSSPISKFKSRGSDTYDAAFFSSSAPFAKQFAREKFIGSGCCLFLYSVRIRPVKLFDVTSVFTRPASRDAEFLLSQEGAEFAARFAENLPEEEFDVKRALSAISSGTWESFDPDSYPAMFYYDAFLKTILELGYRGWLEFEAVEQIDQSSEALNIALLRPDEDAVIVKSKKFKGRLNPHYPAASFIAYHGSHHGDCGEIDTTFDGKYDGAMFFSFDPAVALDFSLPSGIPHVCSYEIPHSVDDLFNPEDPQALAQLEACVKKKMSDATGAVPRTFYTVVEGIGNYDWTVFDPAWWAGQIIKECLTSMGFVGWLERERPGGSLNFGLYSAVGVTLRKIDYFCSDCGSELKISSRGSLVCDECETEICPRCADEFEMDEDLGEIVQTCACEITG